MSLVVLGAILAVLVILLVVNGYFIMREKDKPESKDREGENGHN
jgi:hypothetical protein